jgi:CDP-glycerol glycerophosphotransferase (TagB/SpsB family)
VAGDETSFVRDFAENLRNFAATRDTIIMLRPYPMNASIWKGFKAENVVVWPPDGEMTDIAATQQNYFHSMFYSRAVVGVNTTAMIEAAVVDKPCVTILTERYQATQTGRGHFHHLLKADFLEIAHGFTESASLIQRILAGEDVKADNRRKFVHEFVRPCGLDRSVASLFATRVAGQAARHEGFRKPSDRT